MFLRSPKGWALSPVARKLVAHATEMEQEALAAGRDEGLEGKVRITAWEWLVRSVLGPALVPFATQNPGLELELVGDPRHLNLSRREADVALRPSRFRHEEVFQREIALLEFGLYAAESYLSRHGLPDFGARAEGHASRA